jgi:murein DD-endopeptidase MepM/ murein hydrolase activator NlpD
MNLGGTQTLTTLAAPTPSALCDPTQSKIYCVYTVQEDDTLSDIAAKFNLKGNDDLTAWEMLAQSNKPDVVDEDDLSVGQKLRIPIQPGIIHTILSAQTLSEIADQYDVSGRAIMAVAGNGIANPDALKVGQELLVPNPTRYARPAPAPAPSSSASSDESSSSSSASAAGSTGPSSGAGFIWPTSGPISSRFGPGHPLGIDIDLFRTPTAPIMAAASGTVTFAGGNTCCSYGLYVIVDHGNGYQTLYAHLSRIAVDVGQRVSQGTVLGSGGRTGYATGNHLHFEVHRNGSVINPMGVLP